MAYDPRDKAQNWLPGYVCTVADRFGLRDWTFDILSDDPDHDDDVLSVCPIFGRKTAQLKISEHFWESSREAQRQGVVHELTHAHFAGASNWVRAECKPRLWRAFLMNFEYGVDGLADAVAPFMPLPPRAPKKTKQKTT